MSALAKSAIALCSLALLAACGRIIPESTPTAPADPASFTSALMAGVTSGPSVAGLRIGSEDARAGLRSFVESCPSLLRRDDATGLTRQEDWRAACDAARSYGGAPESFFETYFETARIGSGEAFATGYFEPEIRGCRTRKPGCEVPVYALPDDLTRAWPADMPESERTGRPPLGRFDDEGNFVRYYDRTQIEEGALEGSRLELAWAADPVEMFFLQIQGSGRLALDDGTVMRIGYAGQNGHGYTGIGGVMRERGLLGDGPGQYAGSMQGIMQYIRENPEEGRDLMRLNKSWIFFTELTGDGPLGSLGIPVRRESSVAVDPKFVPYGAPVWLDLDRDVADGLWIAQDTGGAIKGANRFDTFWGAGEDARTIAGGMSGRGTAYILLPKGTVDRLNSQ
ncbi:murein transglycosylase A [Pontixanthobacter aquaemixtae]|uniref:peptidoglycan lytic exotransglycosylase n=1 Tax=Pontixanthobacter aquaemixtae TaxID=1958940 RepID=A0A845A2B1_9SPHN|nr:murein transglycosylase A [Pontixanthobacter aquaemixtae]MXO91759.1 hypothetical protein [Pontixanthobacter aquaemixtae]